MIRMIIADDEYIVRDGLKNIIPWEDYGIEVAGEAVDGQEALELCLELKPDVLLTDIRMPIMDGLEVAMELKEMGKDIKIIIVSGVQDFEYAKTALSINAVGYILKPVKIPELEQTVKKVVEGIDQERRKKLELQNLQKQLHVNLPAIREKFVRSWVTGMYRREDEIAASLDYLGIPLKADESMLAAVLQIDEYFKASKDLSENDKQLLFFSISNILEEIIGSHGAGACSCINDNEFVIIFNEKTLESGKHLAICNEFILSINKYLKIDVSVGVGRSVAQVLHLSASYKDALMALQHSFYTGKNSLLDINDIIHVSGNDSGRKDLFYPNLYEQENRIINSMRLGNIDDVGKDTDELFAELSRLKGCLPSDYVQNICLEMFHGASRALYELKEDIDQIIPNRPELMNAIYKTGNIFDMQNMLKTTFVEIASHFAKKYTQKNTKIIEKIKEIIEERYSENIGTTSISDEIYLSPNYISLIFKQETGMTITEYITRVRMENAKKLLSSSAMKVLEVAEKVGFENAHYFSTVFRKYTGIHPQKFRTNIQG